MKSQESNEGLKFDQHTIRGFIGLVAMLLPVLVVLRAGKMLDSISWSYHTDARDIFVGCLFAIGAFLISYKGHQPTISEDKVYRPWKWLSGLFKGAFGLGIRLRRSEEDLVGWLGGIAAIVTALFRTAFCTGTQCPPDPISKIHYIGASILFLTTAYFCLVAFRRRIVGKIKNDESRGQKGFSPKELRKLIYDTCGWLILAIIVILVAAKAAKFDAISNLTFWSEFAALELFGVAWMVASQYVPLVTDLEDWKKPILPNNRCWKIFDAPYRVLWKQTSEPAIMSDEQVH